jgi:hypothetical protein
MTEVINTVEYGLINNNAESLLCSSLIESMNSEQVREANHMGVKDFLRLLYGDKSESGCLVLWTKNDRRSFYYSTEEFDKAAAFALELSIDRDVYYGIGLQREKLDIGRGTEDTIICLPGLWLDIDIKGLNHNAVDLPPDTESALGLIKACDLEPTMVVSTGGGLHVYWLFDEPMILNTEADRSKAKLLSQRFQESFIKLAETHGWKIDNTSDLARVLRLPGTLNHKQTPSSTVKVIKYNEDYRYKIDDFGQILGELTPEPKETYSGDLIPAGRRNTSLTSIAGGLRADGMEYADIVQKLTEVNMTRCSPPLLPAEVNTIANSVMRYEPNEATSNMGNTQVQNIIQLADRMELFHDPDGVCFTTVAINDHKEVWPLKSKEIREYLAKTYYDRYGTALGSQALQSALDIFNGRARFDSMAKDTYTRTASFDDDLYIDLCNSDWESVKITPRGWEIVKDTPVYFRRSKGMLPLPHPVRGGSLKDLKPFINVQKYDEWILMVSWLFGSFNPIGPYPILILQGEQGSAKSTTARVLRELIDPSSAPLRTPPGSERDLMISAKNGWILSFDNLSGMKNWMSDAFCRLSTGGGFSTRGLYSDAEETIFNAMRPILLNGIDDIANRNDLADRSIIVTLPRIAEGSRKLERELWIEFEAAKPKILGALLDAVSLALKNKDIVQIDSNLRMADFAQWVVSAEPELPWEEGMFMDTYKQNREESSNTCFESDVVAIALKAFIEDRNRWEGTASELLKALEEHQYGLSNHNLQFDSSWPKRPNYLSGRISRIAPSLRSNGIALSQFKNNGKKFWKFSLDSNVRVDE